MDMDMDTLPLSNNQVVHAEGMNQHVVDQFSLAILYEENEIVKGSPNMIKEL
jgi:hypothetical protein